MQHSPQLEKLNLK